MWRDQLVQKFFLLDCIKNSDKFKFSTVPRVLPLIWLIQNCNHGRNFFTNLIILIKTNHFFEVNSIVLQTYSKTFFETQFSINLELLLFDHQIKHWIPSNTSGHMSHYQDNILSLRFSWEFFNVQLLKKRPKPYWYNTQKTFFYQFLVIFIPRDSCGLYSFHILFNPFPSLFFGY